MITVKECVPGDLWNGKQKYKVTLSDLRVGESFSPIPVGTTESDIELQQNGKFLNIKLLKKNGFSGGGGRKPEPNNAAFCLSYAKDIVLAMIPGMDKPKSADLAKVTVAVAEEFYKWIQEKK